MKKYKYFLKIVLVIFMTSIAIISLRGQNGPGGVGNSNGSASQPQNIMWLDANYLSLNNNDPVSEWTDRSGNDNHALQATGVRQPLFNTSIVNGFPIIYFENNPVGGGEEDFMAFDGNVIVNTDFTVFYVAARRNNGANFVLAGTTESANQNMHFGWRNATQNTCNHWSNDIYSTLVGDGSGYVGDGTPNDDYGIFMNRLASAEGNPQRRVFQNGTQIGSLNNATQLSAYGGSGIARWRATPNYYDINVTEVVFYTDPLNTAQRTIVENYLGAKYSITITNSRYSGAASGFYYDVAGIGAEADGTHARAASAGLYIYENASSLAATEYVMFGHNDSTNNSTTKKTGTIVTNAGAQAAWNREWYIDATKTDGIDAKLVFDFKEALTDGEYPQNVSNYVLLYRATNGASDDYAQVTVAASGLGDADQVYFDVSNANLLDGFYTIGTTDDTNSPVEGAPGVTWYTLVSGDWEDSDIWTMDPSGALPNNPGGFTPTTSPSSTSDKVVILSGRTITISVGNNNKTHSGMEVQGRLDVTTTTGHNFGSISGGGRILLAADNFPAGDATHFISEGQGEGTVVHYGASHTLANDREYYNLEIIMDAPANIVTLTADYTLNGNLLVENGVLKINDDAATDIRNIIVKKDVIVETNGQITTGTGNTIGAYSIPGTMPTGDNYFKIFHQFEIYGDFTNNGSVRFTNQADPIYNQFSNTGAVTVWFKGASNNDITLYGTTDFYNLIVDKGTDKTYQLKIYSNNANYFRLFGANNVGRYNTAPYSAANPCIRKALWVHNGTLKLTGYINIPTLSEGNQAGGNGDYAIGQNAAFWMAGENVTVYSTANDRSTVGNTQVADGSGLSVTAGSSNQAMSVYGKFRISNGVFGTRNSAGFIFWNSANAQVYIEGGDINVAQMRSAGGGSGVASYVQSGGTVLVRGDETEDGEYTGAYPLFGLETTDAVFHMSGGEIILRDEDGDNDPEWYIPSSEGNYNVTGGKVTINVRNTRSFQLYSTANFWDLEIINNTGSGNMLVQLDTNLTVSNDLTLNPYVELDVEDPTVTGLYHNVTIGRNFSIDEGAAYTYGTNTTTFNGTEDGELYIGHNTDDGYEQYFYNFIVNKSVGKQILVIGDVNKEPPNSSQWFNRLVHIVGTVEVKSGILNQGKQSVRLFGAVYVEKDGELGVYEAGTTELTAYVMLRDGDVTLNTEVNAIFGNIKLNTTGTVTLTTDVYFKRIGYYIGLMNLQTYNAKIDYLHNRETTNNFAINNGSSAKMIYTDANASDGGISLLIHANGTYALPLGTRTTLTRYTPAEVIVTNFSDSGYVQISPADKVLATTDPTGGNILSYYWRVRHEEFITEPTVEYNFHYDESDLDGAGDENQFRPGFVTDEDPYTRNFDGNQTGVDQTNNIINFDNTGVGFTLERANYTAGRQNRFNGPLRKYYSVTASGQYDWNVAANWYRDTPDTGPPFIPTDGSIVIIRGGARMNIYSATIADVAVVEFDHDYGTNPTPTSENVPRMQFRVNGTYDVGNVKGTGMVSFNATRTINLSGDFGDFGTNLESYYLYFGGNATLNSIPTPIPNLMIESATYTIDQDIIVNADLVIQGNATVTPIQDVHVKDDILMGYWQGGTLRFPGTGSSIDITVDDDIDFTQVYISANDRNIIVIDPGAASTLEHNLIVKGDIVHGSGNGYDFDLYNAANRPAVILEFQGDVKQRYYRTSTSVPDFYRIVVNKGTSQNDTITFEDEFTLSGPTNGLTKALEMQNGVLQLDDTDIDINLSTGGSDFDIPATTSLQVTQGTVNIYGDDNGISLNGKLLVDGGTVDMINGAGNGNNYIEYSSSGSAEIEVSAGNLWVGSQIRRSTITEEGILSFTQSGGEVQLGVSEVGNNDRAIFEILNTGSSFTHSAGNFYIVNDGRTGPSIASFYYDPETSNLTTGTQIQFGNANTTASSNAFTIHAVDNLMNVTVNNNNNPTVTLSIVPLTLQEDLTITANSSFDANSLDLTINGDFTNNGTFSANGNTTIFSGSGTQNINGVTTTFYNLTKSSANLLDVNTDIIIENEGLFNAGTLNDNSNEIYVQGDINLDVTHNYGGSGNGITLNGTSQQVATGNGTIGKLTIDNASGVEMPLGNSYTITDELELTSGVFEIGKNLLKLEVGADVIAGNPFSETNMISTNISFTDNGVEKVFPSGGPQSFIFPMGAGGKYTPVSFTITANGNSTGSITVKGANERHPSVQEDAEAPDPEIVDIDNVLQYHWVLKANGISNFSATAKMLYDTTDVEVTAPYTVANYITARLLSDGSGNWNKFDVNDVDEINHELDFTFANVDDAGIAGDYTAGIDDAIPDQVPFYETNQNGDWTDGTIWTPNVTGGPRGAMVRINVGDTVTVPSNFISSYTTEINGVLKVDSTFGHRLGDVTGTGTLYTKRESLPAGFYNAFCSSGGGTLEYGGLATYDILASFTYVNNLTVSGTGEKRFPNTDLTIYGDLLINGDDASLILDNDHDQKITISGDITKTLGVFDAGLGANAKVLMDGSAAQTITGDFTGTSAFYHFELDNSNGLTLAGPAEIDGGLTFTNGVISSTVVNLLTIDNTSETAVTGYSSVRYVDGPMRKRVLSGGNFVFPVGDGSRYGKVDLVNTSTTGAQYWEAQYYDANPHNFPMDTSLREAGLEMVSGNEYWRVEGPAGDSSRVRIRWDDQSLLPAMTSDRVNNLMIAEWLTGQWQIVDGVVTDGGVNSGTILSDYRVDLDEHYFTLGTSESAPLPAAGFITLDTSICAGTSADLRVQLGGSPDWTIYVWDGSSTTTYSAIGSSPYTFNVTPGITTTYTIDSVSDNTGATTSATIFGSPVTVTVVPLPINTYSVTGGGPYCAGGAGVVVGLDDSEIGVTYELYVGGVPTGSTVAGDGSAVSFGNQTTAGNYTVEGAKDVNTNCTQTMTGNATVTVNPVPALTFTVDAVLDTICTGNNTQIEIDFTAGAAPFDFTVARDDEVPVTTTENLTNISADPYTYIPATAPVWVDDGSPETVYIYRITTITDNNGCSSTNIGNEKGTVFKVPGTGPQYHIGNTWAN